MLDGCDEDECYKTMMAERTDLIKARREAEDNLVKTVIQLSATLIALIAGFLTQTSVHVSSNFFIFLVLSVIFLVVALMSGLAEHLFSSHAYLEQQQSVEKFYTRQINSFAEPWANRWVRTCQVTSFIAFVTALIFLTIFAIKQAGEDSHGKSLTTSSPATSAAASSPTTTTTTTSSPAAAHQLWRQQGVGNEVGSAKHAAAATEKR